jgi:aminoglycoside phosphotransferase (APT) family kinase protein
VVDADLVIDLVEGPTLLHWLLEVPTLDRAQEVGTTLADLHHALHLVPPLDGGNGCLLHLDLHPDNVLLSAAGPVVIDWTNATSGPAALDVAMTWVIIGPFVAGGDARGIALLDQFLRLAGRDGARRELPEAAARRLADPNLAEHELAAVRRLLAAEGVALPRLDT